MDLTVLYPLLPYVFASLLGIAILVYVILDGFDLGVGILFAAAPNQHRDSMIASIGPFWDGNETWLVLAVGLLLVAFPYAYGTVLTALYLPVAIMLFGLIGRGVAFEFRAKANADEKWLWNGVFFIGSLVAALSQGYMLGLYVLGLQTNSVSIAFGIFVALCLAATYATVGAAWLIYKTDGPLQSLAVTWMKRSLVLTLIGMIVISIATPLASPRIFDRWFTFPDFLWLAPMPLLAGLLFIVVFRQLQRLPDPMDRNALVPFACMAGIMALGFVGLAFSFFPYVVPDELTIEASASAPESLIIILAGALVVVPTIIGYSIFAYRVFGGKTIDLSYD